MCTDRLRFVTTEMQDLQINNIFSRFPTNSLPFFQRPLKRKLRVKIQMRDTAPEKFQWSPMPPPSHLIPDSLNHRTLLKRMKELSLDRKTIQTSSKTALVFLMM